LSDLNYSILLPRSDQMHRTIAGRTRKIYDTGCIHLSDKHVFLSRAGARLRASPRGHPERDASARGRHRVGWRCSAAWLRRIPREKTFGLDLSPNMAARTQHRARRRVPCCGFRTAERSTSAACLSATRVSMRWCAAIFSKLLSQDDISSTLREIRRVLRPKGTFALVVIGQNARLFNRLYGVCGQLVPAFWGRQVEHAVPDLVEEGGPADCDQPLRPAGPATPRAFSSRSGSAANPDEPLPHGRDSVFGADLVSALYTVSAATEPRTVRERFSPPQFTFVA